MQSVASYQVLQPLSAAAPRGGFFAYVRAGSLSIWLFTLVFPFLWVRDWDANLELQQQGVDFKYYFYIGLAVTLATHLSLGLGHWMAVPFRAASTLSGKLFTTFCAVVLVVSPLSLVPTTSLTYAAGTYAVYLLLYLYWEGDYRIIQRMIVLAGIVVMAWLAVLAIKLGLTLWLGIGGINRNTTGFAGLGAMTCCMMSPRKSIRWTAVALAAGLSAAVTSRGSLIALAAFLAAYHISYRGTFRGALDAIFGLCVAGVLALVWPPLHNVVFEQVFMLHDTARGIGSGFTGRLDAWKQALEAFWDQPIFGAGFRVTMHRGRGSHGAVHSGYLKILVETGLVGAFFIFSAVGSEAVRRFRIAARLRELVPGALPGIDAVESRRINAIAFATVIMTLVIWVYEQLYINLGSVISVVFFLMLVAPTYITTQGSTVRQ
jgi:O-Antigen ligase